MVEYLPYEERKPDTQYRRMIKRILVDGEPAPTRQGVTAHTLIQQTLKYDLKNGFPAIPDRDVSKFWDKGIGELCAFMNGITTAEGLNLFGASWWGAWTTPGKCALFGLPAGEIGPASYGGVFHDFPTLDGSRFDQFSNLVRQIKELPDDRVHAVSNWMPAENARGEGFVQGNTIAPCHGDLNVRILNGRIHLHMKQRSCDTPVGGPSNMIQYAALLLMLEQLTGFKAGVFYHTIFDAHVYDNQVSLMKQLVRRPALRLPTVTINEEGRKVTDIMDFRRQHFTLTDYFPHVAMPTIPVST